MTNSLADLTARLLSAATKAGADTADAVAIAGTSLSSLKRDNETTF